MKRRRMKKNQLKINGNLLSSLRCRLNHIFPQNQLLALDKENNSIQTTIHSNLLVDSFYTASHGSNNNLLSEMNNYNSNNVQSLSSPTREDLLIDGNECTDQCNRNSCNCINNESGNNNEIYGKEQIECRPTLEARNEGVEADNPHCVVVYCSHGKAMLIYWKKN